MTRSTSDGPGYDVPVALAAGMLSTLVLAKYVAFDAILALGCGGTLAVSTLLLVLFGKQARPIRVALVYVLSVSFFLLLTWVKVEAL